MFFFIPDVTRKAASKPSSGMEHFAAALAKYRYVENTLNSLWCYKCSFSSHTDGLVIDFLLRRHTDRYVSVSARLRAYACNNLCGRENFKHENILNNYDPSISFPYKLSVSIYTMNCSTVLALSIVWEQLHPKLPLLGTFIHPRVECTEYFKTHRRRQQSTGESATMEPLSEICEFGSASWCGKKSRGPRQHTIDEIKYNGTRFRTFVYILVTESLKCGCAYGYYLILRIVHRRGEVRSWFTLGTLAV